ncbi:3'-5' exonuclease [Acanthopleuribacter pedis]|uniref:Exonuclease domain-containing protein n=1 Tax=Acanthopleuribacter pedis TaxID=442870 RepID=A0A8J7U2Z8_9BACT|nr:3'-5' exonuclease [Acanthopleuribacter pedis]MBO1317803.1 exonuclease domain-containing protein [Acanthopleuribacter pedis]
MTYLIVDFEATCCDAGSVPRNEMEIIEIGAVALDPKSLRIIDEFERFVKPQRHPLLTNFCASLTSITQRDLDRADSFPEVLKSFQAWIGQFENPVFCSWGNYDKNQLLQDCRYFKVPFPFDEQHINIKQRFAENKGYRKGMGLGRAIKTMGLTFHGTAHRGIDDARNMARLAPHIFS